MWNQCFPPMPMKLCDTAVLCTGNHLVVVAHSNRAVHVMDTTSLEWFSVSSLPVAFIYPSLTVCGTELYVLDHMTSAIFSCSLRILSAVQPEITSMWKMLTEVPAVDKCTCTTLCGELVAVGGSDVELKQVDTVHLYNPSIKSWEVIGHMPTARHSCLVATVPGDALVVIGGATRGRDTWTQCDVVEVAYPV